MALERLYPQNITPNGTNVQQGFINDDKEIKRVLGLIDDTNSISLAGTKRQCVLYGSVDSSGNPNFLTASGLNVSIDGSTKPIILSFANGFSSTQGTVDVLDAILSAISNAYTIPANGTYYLYIDKDINTGLLSYGYTASVDQYLKAAPSSPVLDQHYFDLNEMKMYRYNGSSWEQKLRIFVGIVVTDASTATLTIYDMASKTVSSAINILKRNNSYSIGDIAYSPNLPSWARIECVATGKTAMTEPIWPTTAGQYITDGAAKWIVDDVRDGNCVGDIVSKLYIKAGYIKANGSSVNRADYPRLLKFATDHSLFYDDGTRNFTGTTVAGSTTISGISTTDIAKLWVGMTITGTGIAVNTVITAVSTTSITISNAATAAGTSVTLGFGNISNFPALFGNGDRNITFVLPDWRGAFLRFLDDGKGYDTNRMLGSYQGDAFKTHNHPVYISQNYNTGSFATSGYTIQKQQQDGYWFRDFVKSDATGDIETRPKNIAMYPLIKY